MVSGDGPSLLGRNWLKALRLDWQRIGRVARGNTPDLDTLLDKHNAIFKDELGIVKTYKATLQVCPDAQPKFYKPRPVPFATKDAIGAELERLKADGILERVSHSTWAAPILPRLLAAKLRPVGLK